MLAPTAIDFGAGKTVSFSNKVAPTARIYLHLICRKRHLPLKLRKGKTIGCGAKFSGALPGCVADTVSTIVPNRATGDNRIGSCLNSPLKLRL